MIGHLLYIVGAPGVGKSSVARALRTPWDQEVLRHDPVPHTLLRHPASGTAHGLELGVPRENFPGTDALSMSIGPHATAFLRDKCGPFAFALGEGARLATRPFLGTLATAGVRVTLVHLRADPELLEERWRARGAKQNPSWRKGAETRAWGITQWFKGYLGQDGFETLAEIDCTHLTVDEAAGHVSALFPQIDMREAVPAPPVAD